MVGPHRFVSSRVALVVGFLLAAPAAVVAAPAGDPAAVAKVTELNKKALNAYQQQDWETAKNLLKEALQVCADAGLDQHPITARTHIHFGAVAITGFNQKEAGIKQFKKALEIQPDIKLTKAIVTPELQDAFEQAQLASTGGNDGATAAGGGGEGEGGGAAGGQAAEGGADNAGGGDEDDNTPRRRAPKPRPKKKSGDEDEQGDEGSDKGSGFYLGLSLGSGAGIASGSGHLDPSHKLSGPGFAPGQAGQVEPQLGYFINGSTLLSLAIRVQYISGTNGEPGCGGYCNPTTLTMAALARVTWLLGDGSFHWTVGGQLGGGYVAHAVSFSQTTCGMDGKTGCVDAVLGGPFLIGPTFGLWYDLGDTVGLTAAINSEIGAPKFTFNFDVDVGLGFRL